MNFIKNTLIQITSYKFQESIKLLTISLGLGLSVLDIILATNLRFDKPLILVVTNLALFALWGLFLHLNFKAYKNTLSIKEPKTKDYIKRWLGLSHTYLLLIFFVSIFILFIINPFTELHVSFTAILFFCLVYISKTSSLDFLYPFIGCYLGFLSLTFIFSLFIKSLKKYFKLQ